MKKAHLLLIAITAIGLGFGLSLLVFEAKPVKLEAGMWFGDQARTLPEFELIDHDGQALTKSRLRDRWSLMFFGYTNCPDICPATLQDLGNMMKAITDDDIRQSLQVIFVSVDPDRDSTDILKKYVQYFNSILKIWSYGPGFFTSAFFEYII